MAKQTFTTGQVLTAAQMTSLQQTAMGGGSTTAKVASYVLVAADAGTVVQMNSASATTITVNTALFAAGDTVEIQNVGAGVCTVTAGTATVSTSSVLTLQQYDAGSLYFNSTSAAIFFASDAANSPLTTKGDLFTYSTADARLAVGSNGETLVADSAATTGLAYVPTFFAGKNRVINGDFNIWQRGTSFTPTSATWTFVSDRWQVYQGFSAGTCTVSRQAFTAGAAPAAPYESQYFLRIATGSTNTSGLNFRQLIEDVRTFANQSVTVSFWAKASSAITDLQVDLRQNFGSGGSASVDTVSSPFAITTSWVRYTKTLTNPSISGKTIGTGSALEVYFQTPTNLASSISIDFWGVQVESGTSATSFQTATGTIQGELAACQRYYFRANGNGTAYGNSSIGGGNSATAYWGDTYLPVAMRIAPSSIDTSTISNYRILNYADTTSATPTAVALDTNITTNTVVRTLWTTTGLTANVLYYSRGNNTASSYLGFSAEL